MTETKDEDQKEGSEVQKPCGVEKHETSASPDIKSKEKNLNAGEIKNTSAFKRIYTLFLQNLFREFEDDSESEDEEEDEKSEEKKEEGLIKNSISGDSDCMKETNNNSTTQFKDIWHGTEEKVEPSSEEFKFQKRNLFDNHEHNEFKDPAMTHELMWNKIYSEKGLKTLQMGKQTSMVREAPGIGSVRDYPTDFQFQAFEDVNLPQRQNPGFNGYVCSSPLNLTPKSPGPGASILKETKMTGALCRNLDMTDQ